MNNRLLAIGAIFLFSGCQQEVGTQAWCDTMATTNKGQWSAQNAVDYTKHCILLDAVGSEAWCKDLEQKSRGDWSANDATSYAKHCVF
ncbi:DUF3012 domain-containing protein [Vibrio sp. JPW-9-11-11]|uniref:DUF3012 domain-containing protein n=1 Tax=Vibrio sp. JPW-9-11-11 TaxID=1416532 RepID=UPI001594C08C|nr:DUF3012 domain-containing protein [Vibrio sp. JPW-9-11-11]NVD08453.1 DUF3012 domain-containing protein [Vibrio sp. JPW-9-11-11]